MILPLVLKGMYSATEILMYFHLFSGIYLHCDMESVRSFMAYYGIVTFLFLLR